MAEFSNEINFVFTAHRKYKHLIVTSFDKFPSINLGYKIKYKKGWHIKKYKANMDSTLITLFVKKKNLSKLKTHI